MNIKPLSYKIVLSALAGEPLVQTVQGFAIDSGLSARICVYQDLSIFSKTYGLWRCYDYNTGFAIGPWGLSRQSAIKDCIPMMRQKIANGSYARAVAGVQKIVKKLVAVWPSQGISTRANSDGTGYCIGCGTTIGEEHHAECDRAG